MQEKLYKQAFLYILTVAVSSFLCHQVKAASLEQRCLFHLRDDGSYTYDSSFSQAQVITVTPKAPPSFKKFVELFAAEGEAKENLELAKKELSRLEALEAINVVDSTDTSHLKLKEEAKIRIEELRKKWEKAKAEYDVIAKENDDFVRERDLAEANTQSSSRNSRNTPPSDPARTRPILPPTTQQPSNRRSGPRRPFIEWSLPNGDKD